VPRRRSSIRMRWPCGRNLELRPDCHRRRNVRHKAGGLGYSSRLWGRCRTCAVASPTY
jgi:hypothetical protein